MYKIALASDLSCVCNVRDFAPPSLFVSACVFALIARWASSFETRNLIPLAYSFVDAGVILREFNIPRIFAAPWFVSLVAYPSCFSRSIAGTRFSSFVTLNSPRNFKINRLFPRHAESGGVFVASAAEGFGDERDVGAVLVGAQGEFAAVGVVVIGDGEGLAGR